MTDLLSQFQQQLSQYLSGHLSERPQIKQWVVGLSGGLDSVVLLHLALQTLPPDRLRVIHINHQLQADADRWQQFCETLCQQSGVAIESHRVTIEPGASIERAARDARYRVFESSINADQCLLLAQHRDDQAETLLYRLLRGAGVKGLAAMPRQRRLGSGVLLRPLLSCSREQLQSWAESQQLDWIDDPSNSDDRYDRNFLRQHILPRLAQRWPDFSERWLHTSELLRETDQLLGELAEIDLASCQVSFNGLGCDALMQLSKARRHNLLRYWIQRAVPFAPGRDWLQRAESEVIMAQADAAPELRIGRASLRRFKGQLFLLADAEPVVWHQQRLSEQGLTLPQGRLQVEVVRAKPGLKTLAGIQLRNRQEGDRCRPVGRGGSRSLKKLLQEHNVPPWLRDSWPVCVVGEEIVAVPGICLCQGWQSETEGTGFALKWQPFALSETGDSDTL